MLYKDILLLLVIVVV